MMRRKQKSKPKNLEQFANMDDVEEMKQTIRSSQNWNSKDKSMFESWSKIWKGMFSNKNNRNAILGTSDEVLVQNWNC